MRRIEIRSIFDCIRDSSGRLRCCLFFRSGRFVFGLVLGIGFLRFLFGRGFLCGCLVAFCEGRGNVNVWDIVFWLGVYARGKGEG